MKAISMAKVKIRVLEYEMLKNVKLLGSLSQKTQFNQYLQAVEFFKVKIAEGKTERSESLFNINFYKMKQYLKNKNVRSHNKI